MIKKLDDNLWRISKEFSPFVLLMFYQSQPEIIRLKVFEQKQMQQERRRYHYKDFTYVEMPDLIRFNFQSLSEIFEEIRIASADCFQFQPEAGVLRVALQFGSKLKQCLFQLESQEYSYIETIELLLSQTQREMSRIQLPDETSGKEMRELKVVNESHTIEISKIYALLAEEREGRLKMQEQFQANLTDLRTEIYELRLSQERREHSSISSQPHYPNLFRPIAEISSAIMQERPSRQVQCINLVEENYMSKIEVYNKNIKLSPLRFRFDQNSGSDKDHAFDFVQRTQRITYRKKDETHRQYASLLQCAQPICLVNFKLIQSKQLTIYVGVLLLQQVKKRSTTRNQNAISYKLCGGELWQDGVRAKGIYERVCPGQVLSLLLDGRNNSMQWWKSGKLLAERVMPLSFQNKQVYPFVDMIHYGDCIEMA